MFCALCPLGWLLSESSAELCEASGDYSGAQEDIRQSGTQHHCESMTLAV